MNDIEFHNSFRFRLFEFIHKNQHSYRDLAFHCILYIYHGTARFICAQSSFTAEAGDFVYLPMGLDYRSSWSNATDCRFLSLGFTYMPYLEDIRYPMQRLGSTPEQRAIVDRISQNTRVTCTTVGLVYQLMGLLQKSMVCTMESKKTALINAAERYWRKNPFATAAETAKHLMVSESSLYTAFRTMRGYTLVEAKHRLLITTAGELLLSTDKSIEAISDQLGFSSAAYFRKVFRELTGTSPRDVRRRREKPGMYDKEK